MGPDRADLAIAVALFAASVAVVALIGEPVTRGIVCAAVVSLPLALRHRAPLLTVALVVAGICLTLLLDVDAGPMPIVAVALAVYTAGRELAAPRAHMAAALGVLWLPVVFLATGAVGAVEDTVFGMAIFGGAWWTGRAVRARAAALATERREQEQRHHDAARLAREQERARIARELHDVVSHSVSVITLQAEIVRRRLLPEQRIEAERLRDIETSARHAMTELRRLLGTLRSGDEPAPLAPQPGLDQLGALAERITMAGLPVRVTVEGEKEPLPAGVDLTAYRVVQEALTNALRHAGPAEAAVVVSYCGDTVSLAVEDTGSGRNGAPPGRGLIGMRERIALYGGELELVDPARGGMRVEAVLPIRGGMA